MAMPTAVVLITSVATAPASDPLAAKGWGAAYPYRAYQLDSAPAGLVGAYVSFSMIPEQLA